MDEYIFLITDDSNPNYMRAIKFVYNCAMTIVEDLKEKASYSLDPYEVWKEILLGCANKNKYVWLPPENCPEELKGYKVTKLEIEY